MKKVMLSFLTVLLIIPTFGQYIECIESTAMSTQGYDVMPVFWSRKYTGVEDYIAKNTTFPDIPLEYGRAIVSFVVSKQCKVTGVRLLYADHPAMGEQALRLIKKSKWRRATLKGAPAEASIKLVVPFSRHSDGAVFPSFRGEQPDAFSAYISSKIKMRPDLATKVAGEKMRVCFVVEETGRATIESIECSPDPEITEIVTKAFQESPAWMPSIVHGKPVRVRFWVPISFADLNR